MKYLPLVWSGIWRKPSRAILMLLQIATTFLLFGLLQGLNSGVKQAVAQAHGDRLYIGSRVSMGDTMPLGMIERVRAIPGVRMVTPRANFGGSYQKPNQYVFALAVDTGTFFSIYDEMKVSKEQIEALQSHRTGAIVGAVVMKRYGWKVGDRIVLQSPQPKADGSRDWTFDIVGSYDYPDQPTNATAVIANYAYLNEARLGSRDTINMVVVKIDSAANAGTVELAIDNAFANSVHETRTQSEADLVASTVQRVADLDFIVGGIIGAVFFAMLFATGALMMQSVRERIPELAVLKTVGYSDRLVMLLILAEGVAFCVFCACLGLALAAFILPLAKDTIGITSLPRIVVVAGIGFAILLALIGGAAPAWRGLKLQVVDAVAGR